MFLRYLSALVPVVFAGCVTDDVNLRMENLEKQIVGLEDRIEDLEAAQKAEIKARDNSLPVLCEKRERVQSRVTNLLKKRSALLINYTEKHPDIVELDRQIRLAQDQMRRCTALTIVPE